MDGQVPEAVKSERLQRLQALIARQQRAFNADCVGRTLDVLLEKPGGCLGQLVGRSPYLQAVQVMAPRDTDRSDRRGTITEVGTNSLFGTLANSAERTGLAAAGA